MRKCSDSALNLRKPAVDPERILRVGSHDGLRSRVSVYLKSQRYGDARGHELDTDGSLRCGVNGEQRRG
jgi:hypothetical protein